MTCRSCATASSLASSRSPPAAPPSPSGARSSWAPSAGWSTAASGSSCCGSRWMTRSRRLLSTARAARGASSAPPSSPSTRRPRSPTQRGTAGAAASSAGMATCSPRRSCRCSASSAGRAASRPPSSSPSKSSTCCAGQTATAPPPWTRIWTRPSTRACRTSTRPPSPRGPRRRRRRLTRWMPARHEGRGQGGRGERERACGNVGGVSLARNRPAVVPSACQCACVCPVSALLSKEVANQLVAAVLHLFVCQDRGPCTFFLSTCVCVCVCRRT
mmetsp:Transcript_36860/g.118947  ORF Transcript_36860/g.118947 Transcript_36860/m.118947 type:complete len:273 (+) Transcript_36860:986-1804(+)